MAMTATVGAPPPPPQSPVDRLKKAVENGERFVGIDYTPTFDAEVIQGLVLGARADCGVQLESVTIAGSLNLKDARGASGGPCNALIMHDCILEGPGADAPTGSPGIDARHSYLQRLSLVNCRSNGLDVSSAVIVGDLKLDGLGPLERSVGEMSRDDASEEDDGQQRSCLVRAQGVRIGGSLTLRRASLSLPLGDATAVVVPPSPDAEDSGNVFKRYGLDLEDAQINGSLTLGPKFTSVGGVCLSGAKYRRHAVDRRVRRADRTPRRNHTQSRRRFVAFRIGLGGRFLRQHDRWSGGTRRASRGRRGNQGTALPDEPECQRRRPEACRLTRWARPQGDTGRYPNFPRHNRLEHKTAPHPHLPARLLSRLVAGTGFVQAEVRIRSRVTRLLVSASVRAR